MLFFSFLCVQPPIEKDDGDGKVEKEFEGEESFSDVTHKGEAVNEAAEPKTDIDKKRPHEELHDGEHEDRETKKRAVAATEPSNVQASLANHTEGKDLATASRALKVEGFVRPFTLHQARNLFECHGTLAAFWMPSIKNVAYAVFSAIAESQAAYEKLNDLRWPVDSPKRLVANFITINEAEQAIRNGENKPDFKIERVEGDEAELVAPEIEKAPVEAKSNKSAQEDLRNVITKRQERNTDRVAGEAEGLSLDDLFRRTQARPAIYWIPVSEDEVGR